MHGRVGTVALRGTIAILSELFPIGNPFARTKPLSVIFSSENSRRDESERVSTTTLPAHNAICQPHYQSRTIADRSKLRPVIKTPDFLASGSSKE